MLKHGVTQKKSAKHSIFGGHTSVHQKILISCFIFILINIALSLIILNRGLNYPVTNSTTHVTNTPIHSDSTFKQNKVEVQFLHYSKQSILILTFCSVISLISVMIFLIKSIADPLHAMEQTTQKLSNGDLDHLMPIHAEANDPIGKIGENVHELAINLQEILLLVWNISEQDLDVLKQTMSMMQSNNSQETQEKVFSNLQLLKKHREDSQDLVREFELFHVILKGKKLLAKSEEANL